MKFGCSLEMVNMRVNEPGFKHKLSKSYWVELFRMVAAAGFKGIELPYNPYSTDGIAFNMARSGMPINKNTVNTKYGSISAFLDVLNDAGIEEITSVHLNANDSLIELMINGEDPTKVFQKLEAAAEDAIEYLSEVGGKGLVISPTPELGLLYQIYGSRIEDWKISYLSKTAEVLNKIAELASKNGVQASIRNDFWSLIRGNQLDLLMNQLDSQKIGYSPELAHLFIANTDPIEVVNKYKERLSFVQFSDTKFKDIENNYEKTNPELPITGPQRVYNDLGEGNVDTLGVYKALKETGYDGWVICNSKKTLNVYKALLKMRWYVDNVLIKS